MDQDRLPPQTAKRLINRPLLRPAPRPLITAPPPPPHSSTLTIETSASSHTSPTMEASTSKTSPSGSCDEGSEPCLYNVNSRQNIITNDRLRENGEEEVEAFGHSNNGSLAGKLGNVLADSFGRNRKLLNGFHHCHNLKSGRESPGNHGVLAGVKRGIEVISRMRQSLVIILTPIVFLPLAFSDKLEYRCAFCVGVMAVYWTTEVLPLAVTALLPVVLFPLTGVLPPKDVAKEFLNDTNFLFIGGLIVATAVEKCDLHERLALRVLTLVGSKPKWIMFGFMSVTALLSMFISNTATTAMMVPIGESVIQLIIQKHNKASAAGISISDSCRVELIEGSSIQQQPVGGKQLKMAKGLMLSICFAANIGGIGTITGTPPNLVMVGMLSTLFPHVENTGVHYLSWMAFAVPLMALCLFACWLILMALFLHSTPETTSSANEDSLGKIMQRRYARLAPMNFAQKSVCASFFVLLTLWIGRDPQLVPGFGDLFPVKDYYTDATSAMLVAILLFILPSEWPRFANSEKHSIQPTAGRLMDWPTMQKRFPWGVVLLLGGGFALAAGVKESGLSTLMGDFLSYHLSHSSPTWALQLVCIGVTMLVTNICSNTVTASIFIPIVATMATEAGIHPLSLMLPTTIACSFAFVLPVGTPPNAIVFSSKGRILNVSDMILSGVLVSVATIGIVIAYLATFAPFVFPNMDSNKLEWLAPSASTPSLAEVVEQLLDRNITSMNQLLNLEGI